MKNINIAINFSTLLTILCFLSCNPSGPARSAETSTAAQTMSVEAPSKTFIKVANIARKTKAEVDAYLGEPIGHESVSPSNAPCPCEKYIYKGGNIEIVYMKDVADWVSVFHMNTVDYENAAILEALGLPNAEPKVKTENVTKWNDLNGYDQISAYNDGQGKLSYIFLKANTH